MEISTVRVKKIISDHRGFLISSFFIILFCLLFFAKGIFLNRISILWDTPNQFFPKLWYTAHVWRKGIFPLWNPFLFNGFPTFADPQSQTFYPFTLAMAFLTVISAKVVYLQLVAHYMLAGIFMYLFSGLYVRNAAGRLIASLIYMFNGFMIDHFEHLPMINSIVWLPLILFFLEKGWRNRNILYFAPAGLSIAFLILAGHPQTTLYILYVLIIFTFYKCFYNNEEKRLTVFPLLVLASSMIFGVLLSAVQIIPTFEFSGLSNRAGRLPYVLASYSGQLTVKQLVTFFFPDYFGGVNGPYMGRGDITHSSIYCGVTFLIMLPFSFIKKRREPLFFAAMALIDLLVSMGDNGFLFKIFYQVLPGFNLFRSPVQSRFVFAFFAALLTGIAVERVARRELIKSRVQYFYICFMAFLAIMIIVYFLPPQQKVFSNVMVDALLFGTFFYAGNVILFHWKRAGISVRVLQIALILLTFFDFYTHGANALTIGTKVPHKFFEKETPVVASLKKEMKIRNDKDLGMTSLSPEQLRQGLFRVYVDDEIDIHNRLLPYFPNDYLKLEMMNFNMAIMHGIFMVDGYNPMILKRYVLINSALRDRDYEKFLMLSNVKYVVKQNNSITVLSDEKTMPRSYIVDKVAYRSSPESAFETLSDPLFDVRTKAVVEEPVTLDGENSCRGKSQSEIIEYVPNKIRLLTENDCSGLLVLSETYYPGWKVAVDSSIKTDAIRVNYYFMGSVVPPGKHTIIFEFNPKSFKIGLIISIISLLSGIIILIVVTKKSKAYFF